ncbi:MAG TPA: hypothetical protein VJ814_05780, partial [Gaiellaceae bacterium]|nr:hypothetical protein [Gaiellaceae bacterium]
FLVAGILHVDNVSIDELRLRGKGGKLLGVAWLAGSLGLIGTPYLGVYLGHGLIDDGANGLGRPWVLALLWLGAAVNGGALLRAGARIFLGWGDSDDPLLGEAMDEEPIERDVLRPLLVTVAAIAVGIGVAMSLVPGLGQRAEYAAERFRDRGAYAARVLRGTPIAPAPGLPVAIHSTAPESVLCGLGATLFAAALAGVGLYRRRLPSAVSAVAARTLAPPIAILRAVHSGVVGDYVMWITVGTALVGGVWALLLRGG